MEMEIDQLDDFETEDHEQEPVEEQYEQEESSPSNTGGGDLIDDLLRDRGIEDKNKIKFEDEDGLLVEKSWNELSKQEQKNILNQDPFADPESELDDQEIEMINQMRLHGMNPYEYVTALRNQGANYAMSQAQPQYQIDDLNDDELYVLDLQYRSPNMTEEEQIQALTSAKQNEDLYKKQVDGLRNYYKGLESDAQQQAQLQQQEIYNQQFKQYEDSIVNSIENMTSIGNLDLDLSVDDKEDIASFILDRDPAGINWFSKALEDPDTVARMAWFALKGEEAFNDIENYIAQQIKATKQDAYNKGLEDGRRGKVVFYNNPVNNGFNNSSDMHGSLDNIDV